MSGLAFAQAPALSHPLRFLASALLWGVLAGLWLALGGGDLLRSPHAPATIALAHAFALGVLGNAMLGSLVQFLPVAAGSPLPLSRGLPLLHAGFNSGVAALLPAIAMNSPVCGRLAAPLLAASLAVFATAVLVAVARGHGARPVRCGIGMAALALLATVALGVALLAMRLGWLPPATMPLTAVHAGFGLFGWVLGLLAAVGAVVLPVLQGTRGLPRVAQWLWLALLGSVLLATGNGVPVAMAGLLPALPPLLFAGTVLALQWRAPHRRNRLLHRFWWLGCTALLGAAAAMLLRDALLAGVLALAAAFPALVLGMLMEIAGFLLWIELRRRAPRGTRVPGVGNLFDQARKHRVWWLHATATLLLVAACTWPPVASIAGLLVLLTYLSALLALWHSGRAALAWQPPGP